MKPPKQYFDFYLHGQDKVIKGVCFSPQKHKMLDEISKSQHDKGCITKKVKLNEKNTDFVLTGLPLLQNQNWLTIKLSIN